ncbi:MAG: transposase [Acidobacteria bacterium RIFCSPLOWO2_02_FULL_68_18]|nr:MAG: transposase [Acidobacteria bacterium RIFCSPLOWO2_02_FULL_68_18]OFW49301.1 MAG: transposase [Acidobacteria bacterium RIFCSPLOWO2_12_FULL_68_19]
MNKLPVAKRAQILSLFCEGTSMRAVSRLADVSINTVTKLLVDAGRLCAALHDDRVRGVKAQRVQVDEIWSFTYAKAKNVPKAKKAPAGAGDTWTWTGLDADSKLIVSWLVGPRDAGSAFTFASDLKARLANRVQLTSDGLKLYLDAVEDVFGADIDYAQLVKLYGASGENETRYSPAKCIGCISKEITGDPDPKHISTSYVERQNLTMRMHMRRFTRLTNGFSKKLDNHVHMIALYTVFYNFTKIHKTLRVTPAMQAGLTEHVWSMEDVVRLLEEVEAPAPAAQAN